MRTLYIIIASLLMTTLCQAQTYLAREDDSTTVTEYIDGKLWAYKKINDCVVGHTYNVEKNDYGTFYQIHVYIQNQSESPITLCPEKISTYLMRGEAMRQLRVYTNEDFQRKMRNEQIAAMIGLGLIAGFNAGMAGYSTSTATTYSAGRPVYTTVTHNYNAGVAAQANMAANLQIMTMGKMMSTDRKIEEMGYLKKHTIHPGEAIIGYMYAKRKKGKVLFVKIPVGDQVFTFDWDLRKNK